MSEEYIKREDVLSLAKDICVLTKWDSKYHHRSIDPIDVMELPAADVREVKRGKWHPHPKNPYWLDCTICGFAKPDRISWNYCPNCGADMQRKEDQTNADR